MAFETFKRHRMPVVTDPAITIQKRGNFSLNSAAYQALESPEAVELLFDRERQLIALRKAALGTEYAYPVRPLNGNARTSSWLVAGMAFAAYYSIPTEIARRWVCRVEDGMLILDLNQPSQEVSSNRDRQKRKTYVASGAAPSLPGPTANGSSTAATQASPQVQQTPGGVGT